MKRAHKNPPLKSILSRMTPIHSLPTRFFRWSLSNVWVFRVDFFFRLQTITQYYEFLMSHAKSISPIFILRSCTKLGGMYHSSGSLWIKSTDARLYTCFGQPFCPSSGVLSRTAALVHFIQLWWPFATRSRMELHSHPTPGSKWFITTA
jgi:hypothetical protein